MRLLVLVALTMTGFAANSLLNRVALTTTETGPMMFALLRLAAGAVFLAGLTISHGGLTRLRAAISLPKAAALAVYMLGFSLAYRNLDA
ncbi:MAG: EamA family transporter, partial [Mangrovicoccus sp.]